MKKTAKGTTKRRRSTSRLGKQYDILRDQVAAFEKKFGRTPGPDDPVFFDPDADEPRMLSADQVDKDIFAAMRMAGTPPEIVYAFKKTGMLLLDELRATYLAEAVAEWDAAIENYFSMEADSKHSDAQPGQGANMSIPATKIPALKELRLGVDEERFVFACLGAIDEHLEKQPTSLRVKTELAAAVLVMGAASAFESASEFDRPEEAEAAYDTFVNLVVLRARELFERQM